MLRKIFNMKDFRRIKLYAIGAVISIALFIPIKTLVNRVVDPPFEKWLESRHEAKKQDIQEEYVQRRVEKEKNDNNSVMTPHVSSIDRTDKSTDKPSTELMYANGNISKGSEPRPLTFPGGQYKGMTLEEVQALQKRKSDLRQRKDAYWEKSDAVWSVRNQNMDNAETLMLSVFKSMSSEQLKHMKEEALQGLPPEDVNFFFDDIKNKGIKMTGEQLNAEAKRLLSSDKTFDIVLRELEIEWEGIKQQHIDIYGEESYIDIYESD